jgi:outer membrane protein insertion porin family
VQSENRLNRVAVLENTRIMVSDIDTTNKIINLKVLGLVRNKYEVQPEVLGYDINNSFYAGLGLSYTDRFFLGNARTFSAKVRALANTVNNYRLEFILDMFQPHIFNNNKITGNLNLSTIISSIEEYRVEEIKSKVSTNYELPKHTYLNNIYVDWKLTNQRITFKTDFGGFASDSSTVFIPSGSFVNILNSIIGLTLVHSKIDNFQFPTRGVYQSYLFEESGLLADAIKKIFDVSTIHYFKASFINKFYLPITSRPDKSTVATKFLIGNIFEYGDNSLVLNTGSTKYGLDVVPIDTKFIAGGSTSVRGWGARKLGTFDGRENGGDFIVEGTIEHRTRPFYDMKGLIRDFGFVSFIDFGNLWSDVKYYKTSDLAVAVGVGLRYYTIVGPVRLDFGFKMYDYEPAEGTNKWLFNNNASTIFKNKFAIQFGIGNTF